MTVINPCPVMPGWTVLHRSCCNIMYVLSELACEVELDVFKVLLRHAQHIA